MWSKGGSGWPPCFPFPGIALLRDQGPRPPQRLERGQEARAWDHPTGGHQPATPAEAQVRTWLATGSSLKQELSLGPKLGWQAEGQGSEAAPRMWGQLLFPLHGLKGARHLPEQTSLLGPTQRPLSPCSPPGLPMWNQSTLLRASLSLDIQHWTFTIWSMSVSPTSCELLLGMVSSISRSPEATGGLTHSEHMDGACPIP